MSLGGLTIADGSFLAALNRIQVKVGQFTWNMANADGTQDVDVGFVPEAVLMFANIDGTASASWGSHGGLNLSDNFSNNAGQKQNASGSGWVYDAGGYTYFYTNISAYANGFRNTYTKGSSPTSLLKCNYLALRRKDTALRVYSNQFTRDTSLADGNVSYTGFGFQPTFLFTYLCNNGGQGASLGISDGSSSQCILDYASATNGNKINTNYLTWVNIDGSTYQYASLTSFDSDGLTLSWTKGGSPTATLYGCFIALR